MCYFFIVENDKWLLVHLLSEQDESAHLQFDIVNILHFQCFVNQHFLTGLFVCFLGAGVVPGCLFLCFLVQA